MSNAKLLVEHGIDTARNTLYITGDIDNGTLHDVLTGLAALESADEVTVVLATHGGCPYAAYGIYDGLRQFAGIVKIICIGGVFSAGTIIMQAADERVMTENATLLIHFGAAFAEDAATAEQHKRMDKNIITMLTDAVDGKRTKKTVSGWFKRESYFTAGEALEAGLIDRILNNE